MRIIRVFKHFEQFAEGEKKLGGFLLYREGGGTPLLENEVIKGQSPIIRVISDLWPQAVLSNRFSPLGGAQKFEAVTLNVTDSRHLAFDKKRFRVENFPFVGCFLGPLRFI